MKRLRVLVLMHEDLVPPEQVNGHDLKSVAWRTEYDVVSALKKLGHDVHPLGVKSDLSVIHSAIDQWKPDIAFNLLEEFDGVAVYDQHVVSYLELLHMPYTGCNPRGLMLARDKVLTKKVLAFHRIPYPDFMEVPQGRSAKRPKQLTFPLIVKSVTEEASLGISQASIVEDDDKLSERVAFIHNSVGSGALVERYIEGRELYVGIIGNGQLQVLPVWELILDKLPDDAKRIATERVKWSGKYQQKYGITSREAEQLPEGKAHEIQDLAKRVYRALGLNGYARIDMRMDAEGQLYVLEANPNPQIAEDEDFADSAQETGYAYAELLQELLNVGLRWRPAKAA
ncbi:MAG: D-alanine--D-alanine ligase [Nitrospira sp. HN-bin3]|uniref:D-alanine--D-alanine ligase family protein n=1 Tax=Nitrospira cf. moscoviensis SBR1015 TaxID=96242 RepID=UPI000A0BC029|nr:ATP-grasp domain-containing protein [Nitrospira cf. moscoviensis SBR1015]OQW47340.1 MAG: D-alanine--D-alanine ligase [Nitrospira sp. HN-bin3]